MLQTAGLTDKFLDHSRDLPSSPITHARSHALKHTEKAECPSVAKNTNRLLSQQDPSIAMMHSSRPTEKTDPSHCKSAQTEQAKVEDDMIDLTTCDGERAADNLSSEDVIVVDLLTESEDGSENTDFGEFYARRDDVNGNQGGQQRETDVETRPKSERKRENVQAGPKQKKQKNGDETSRKEEENKQENGVASGQDHAQRQEWGNLTFKGERKNGAWHGQGAVTWLDGTTIAGIFHEGRFPSNGTMTDRNGFKYVGDLRGLEFHGEGVVTWGKGKAEYQGEFADGQFHGQGRHVWNDGCEYVGAWKEGKREGQGFCSFADGSSYDGQWAEDMLHGSGVLSIPGNKTFSGEFFKGFPTKGSLKMESGLKEAYPLVTYNGRTAVGGDPQWWHAQPWSPAAPRLEPLDPDSAEFRFVSTKFLNDFAGSVCHHQGVGHPGQIVKIERVQNEPLRVMYETKAEVVRNKCKRSNYAGPALASETFDPERWLFHSPGAGDALDFIVEEGFTPLLSGTCHGEVFGMGTYFAVKAWRAAQYARLDRNRQRKTIMCKVAVGESSKGSPGVRVPPVNLNAGPGQRFDSFSDDPNNPTIFVVQDTSSSYPAYIITY